MIRITEFSDGSDQRLIVEGKLSDVWVESLETVWVDACARGGRVPLQVDLSGVTYVDDRGRNLLVRMLRNGAELRGSGIMARSVIEELASLRTLNPRERQS